MARVQLGDKSNTSNHGIDPENLSIEQRLASGFILLDKPPDRHRIKSLHG